MDASALLKGVKERWGGSGIGHGAVEPLFKQTGGLLVFFTGIEVVDGFGERGKL